jgi:hypothetical protein
MNLLKDAKFLTALLDTVTTIGLYVFATYLPQYSEFAKIVWGSLQPIFLSIIAAVAGYQTEIRALNSRVTNYVSMKDNTPLR